MALRGIAEAEIEAVLANPDTIRSSSTSANPIYVGFPQGRRIEVVVARDMLDPLLVITMWD